MYRLQLIIVLTIVVVGCASNGYQKFYSPFVDANKMDNVKTLQDGQKPSIYPSETLNRDAKLLISKGFRPIGQSSFNGALEGKDHLIDQAQRVGALVVLVKSKYTDTQTTTTPLFLPNNSSTYSSGLVYGSRGSASYSGSSTTYGTRVVPLTNQQRRFDQAAVYFVKSTKKPKYGVRLANLSPEIRASIQRNTGALVDIVMQDSPAFDANILPGDIIIKVDGVNVRDVDDAATKMHNANPPSGESKLTILRDGERKVIAVNIDGS